MLPPNTEKRTIEILAAEKIIADISSGVYRSPAAALKELVSNSYDADATHVTITTDPPQCRTLTIADNGSGMTVENFVQVITHIGGSSKRLAGDLSPTFKRPLIGRIGIGLLAVAQLGSRFYVSSSQRGSGKKFVAEVNLEPFHRDDAALRTLGKLRNDGQVQIGAVTYVDDLPERSDVQYTVITVPDAKKGLISEITSTIREVVGAKEELSIRDSPVSSFLAVADAAARSKRADLVLDGYYYMLWELGLLCPVDYIAHEPFFTHERLIEGIEQITLPTIQNFHVTVDGIELFRPQRFPNAAAITHNGPDPKLYSIEYDRVIADRPLRFYGYVYAQPPHIHPEELKGIHIRIRNVGIGRYDKSWMGYPFDEGFKFGQITGEIFILDGLEPALNIDRDSFRETDVHYQAMRAYIWSTLRKQVFPDFKARSKKYREETRAAALDTADTDFQEALLQLPSPLLDGLPMTNMPSQSPILVIDGRANINQTWFSGFARENSFTNEHEARFLRVLIVLLSADLLETLTEEELSPLLTAIAVATK
jgi:Histidine kinase-, DNA gyrase B-, and HSP90-like ATPase